jgi:hypothetical protein
MEYTFRALPLWPHPTTHQRRSRYTFKARWSDTLEKLGYEIGRMNGSNVVIAAGFQESEIRRDGMPRANARIPTHPGVEISFDVPPNGPGVARGRKLVAQHGGYQQAIKATHPDTSGYASTADFQAVMATQQKGRMVLATDEYEDWQSNARAIALTLEALRAVDRYGATQGRQYAGFQQQLTAGSGS